MTTHIVGFRLPDDAWSKHLAVWRACERAGVPIPVRTLEFFDNEDPGDKPGKEISIDKAVTPLVIEGVEGFEVDIAELPEDVRIIRFYNSW
jgi:hypothetical protein